MREHQDDELFAFVFFLEGTQDELKALNDELGADNIALGLIPTEAKDKTQKLYKLNPDVESTLFVYRAREVEHVIVDFDASKDSDQLKEAIQAVCR